MPFGCYGPLITDCPVYVPGGGHATLLLFLPLIPIYDLLTVAALPRWIVGAWPRWCVGAVVDCSYVVVTRFTPLLYPL